MPTQTEILRQIDEVLGRHAALRSRSHYDDCSDLPDPEIMAEVSIMCDTIRRFAPNPSQYLDNMQNILSKHGADSACIVPYVAGILKGLRVAYESGYLSSIEELIHGDVFSDFAEMAGYLLAEGYKDPAAVIIGSVLEEHLRKLCDKNGIAFESAGKPKKADQLNSDLAAKTIYSKLDQKSITSWLDLRNKAAHGKYAEYTKEQVALLIQSIQDFMTRIPA